MPIPIVAVCRSALRCAGLLLVLAVGITASAQQDEWPGFRGRTGAGTVAATLDTDGLAPTVLWRVEAGVGYSGVTVVDGKAITMFEDGVQVMVAYDAETGAEIWRTPVAESYPGRDGSWNGPIATPVAGRGLIVGFEPWGRLFALDVASGDLVWSVHIADDLGAPRPVYGFGSSPLLVGDTVVVHGGPVAGSVLGFDLGTGEQRWSVGTEGVDNPSPVALTLAGSNMVVATGMQTVYGIEAATGDVVWEYAHNGDGYRGAGSLVPVGLADDQIFLAHSDNESQVISVRADGEAMVAEQVWLDRVIRNSYTVAVHHEGYIYAYSARILLCVDAATGEMQWRSRAPGDGFITLVGDEMVILTKDGTLHVARATPDGYQEVASATVFDELTWTPSSYAYGDIFARSLNEVVRIDLHGGTSAAPAVASATTFNVPRSLPPGDGDFGNFVRAAAAANEPAPLIDNFLAAHPGSPIVESETLVHFVYRGPGEAMAIQGDFVGSRQEAPMERVGASDLFYYSVDLLPGSRVTYTFANDAATFPDPGNPLQTELLIFDADREFNFGGRPIMASDYRTPGWVQPAHLREPVADLPRGEIESFTVTTEALGPLTFEVYLPPGYTESETRYPVVYYHGQAPREVSAIPLSLDNLIADGMRPVIAVFAENFVPPAPPFVDIWAQQVVPHVDTTYRTIATADGRVAVGTALGTLSALFIAFAHPELTSAVALQSLFFLDSDWDALTPILVPASERPLRIYLDWGVYGIQNPQEAWDLRADSIRRRTTLEELGFTVVGGEANDGAGWAAWRNRHDAVLEALLPQEH
jgi:outer membrane protein assembly factor BamB